MNDQGRGTGHLAITLLGRPLVTVGRQPVLGPQHERVLALLAFLAIESGRPHARTSLAAQFWPDEPAVRAHQNLRQCLSRLRRAIGDERLDAPHLLADVTQVQFNRAADYRLDVEDFAALMDATDGHGHRRLEACPACMARLREAIECYRGPLLDGFHLAGASVEFDEWLTLERERLGLRAAAALQALANGYLARGRAAEAQGLALRLLGLDPWNEAAERLMLRTLARNEGRAPALAHFRAFSRALAAELAVEPEDATRDLADRIRAGTLTDANPHDPAGRLPVPTTPLVGRQAEVDRIRRYLAGRDERLVTVHGPGGMGKSRLAIEVARREAPLWRDGVWFVPLAEVAAPTELPRAIAYALGLTPARDAADMDTVAAALRGRELLVVLDAFEHLVAGAAGVGRLVQAVPGLKVLVTSRARLGLPGEWVVDLEGLAVPDGVPAAADEAEEYDAVRLFAKVARQGLADFALTPDNIPDVVRICRLVAGLPLGIELAASWVRLMSCRQTADQVERDPGALHEPGVAAPGRGQSLRAMFDYSYMLLAPERQSTFRRLSVFRGGFTPDAAGAVAGADTDSLATLVDHSLVRRLQSGRLDIHAVLRDLAAERLAADPDEAAATLERHAAHFLGLLTIHAAALASDDAAAAVAAVGAERENVRAAWERAVERRDVAALRPVVRPLGSYFFHSGRFPEGQEVFARAADRVLAGAPDDPAVRGLGAHLRVQEADLAMRRGLHAEADRAAAEAAALAGAVGDARCEAEAEFRRGVAQRQLGHHAAARAHLQRALDRQAAADQADPVPDATSLERRCLNDLAALCFDQGDLLGAEGYLGQMRDLCLRQGNRSDEAVALGNMGMIAEERGDYALALDRYRESQRLAAAVGRRTGAGHLNVGELLLELGAYGEAEPHLQRALAINREQGALKSEALALRALALLHHHLGQHDAAVAHATAALEIIRRLNDPSAEAHVSLCLGRALAGQGALDEAAAAYAQALALQRELGQHNRVPAALAGLAGVSLRQGDLPRAAAHVEGVLDCLDHAPLDGVPGRADVAWRCFQVLAAAGDPRAATVLAAAHDDLLARAERISDEALRRSFLDNVAVHRAITAAWSQHTEAAGTATA
jgi:predicted ATPase/DNA-binding SARP family transcriptional activator